MGISIHWQEILLASTRIRWKGVRIGANYLGLQSVATRQRWRGDVGTWIQTLINSSPLRSSGTLRVDPKTVTRWAKAGKLTSIRTLGGHRRYRATEVHALLDAQSGSVGQKLLPRCITRDASGWIPSSADVRLLCRS